MRISTRGLIALGCIAAALVASAATDVCADEIILSLNAHLVDTAFTPTGGLFDIGELVADEVVPMTRVTDSGQITLSVDFSLIAPLSADLSVGGHADGFFENGTLVIAPVIPGEAYLTADVISLRLEEVFDDRGMLAGTAVYEVTGGSWAASYGGYGRISQITFRIVPTGLDDFDGSFAGLSDITLTPVPEPATLLLVGTGVLGVIGYARRRRMR